jgi:2,3-dihydroxybiphenyl 1,2-dioxygenase
MHRPLHLAYLVFGAAKPQAWDDFCSAMLGLPEPLRHADGSSGWRVDGAAQRLLVQPDRRDDLVALGLDCGDHAALEQRRRQLAAAGCELEEGSAALCESRRVERLLCLRDPEGNRVELCAGLEPADREFRSDAFPGGFRTGSVGLGHAALVTRRLAEMQAFYCGLLGFGVTEQLSTKVGPVPIRGVFLHCNARHHSLALFDLPGRKRLHHFMLQANDVMDVGRAFERSAMLKVPLSLALGQHPDPDGTFSFYGRTPSGFDFEIGAGSKEIDPVAWEAVQTSTTSSWGHRPALRLKLRMAGDLVAGALRR